MRIMYTMNIDCSLAVLHCIVLCHYVHYEYRLLISSTTLYILSYESTTREVSQSRVRYVANQLYFNVSRRILVKV